MTTRKTGNPGFRLELERGGRLELAGAIGTKVYVPAPPVRRGGVAPADPSGGRRGGAYRRHRGAVSFGGDRAAPVATERDKREDHPGLTVNESVR